MKCTVCQHSNDGGNFCENCGARMTAEHSSSAAVQVAAQAGTVQQSAPQSVYLEKTKNMSKMYLSYFLTVLKRPYRSSESAGQQEFANGMITMILYAALIPVIFYFYLKGMLSELNNFDSVFLGEETAKVHLPFTDFVFKPALAYLAFILLLSSFSFFAVKLGKQRVTLKDAIGRFGSLLIPFAAMLVLSLLLALLGVELLSIVLLLAGFLGSITIVPPLFIASYKNPASDGLDPVYGTLLVYCLTGVLFYVMGEMMFDTVREFITELIGDIRMF